MKKLISFFSVLLSIIILNSCKSSSPAVSSGKTKPVPKSNSKALSTEEHLQADYLFFNAIKEKSIGNPDKAKELFSQVIRIDDSNDAAFYELAQLYYQKEKFQDALFFAKTAAQLKPANEWYQLLLADVYMNTGKVNEAIAIHGKLAKSNPNQIDYYFNWANALIFAGKIEEAIKVYDMVEQRIGIEKDLIVRKERMYLKLGKIDKAASEIEKLIKENPTDLGAYSLLVELYQANNLFDNVLATIERMKKINPSSPYIYLSMAEYYRSIKDNGNSFEQLKLAFRSPELDSEIKIRILSSYFPLVSFKEEMLQQALELADILTVMYPSEAMAHAILADFLNMADKPKEAVAEYRLSLDLDKDNEQVWQQYLFKLNETGDNQKMLTECEEALSLFPNNPVFYLLNGVGNYDLKDYPKAVEILLSGSKLVVDNANLLIDFYSRLGDCYHELKNDEESDNYYEKALKLNPKNAYVLNNYSYYLSLRKVSLDKAESMSKQSIELMPDQASFLDTYAWILYQKDNYNEAKIWIEKAIQHNGSSSATILEHYGDILFKLQLTNEAVEQWKKAKSAGSDSKLLDKKIADQKLYE